MATVAWPMPEKGNPGSLKQAKTVVVAELNMGQLAGEVRKFNDYGRQVTRPTGRMAY